MVMLVFTYHENINYKKTLKEAKIIANTLNAFRNVKSNKIVKI